MAATRHPSVLIAAAFCAGAAASFCARADEDLEARVNRIESQTLVELLTRIDRLQNQVQQLSGQIEEQTHAIEGLQQRQRDLYMELDGRLRKLEQGGAVPPPSAATGGDAGTGGATPPPATGTPPATGAPPPSAGNEQADYQQAFNLLKQSQYPEATLAFRGFIEHYPDSPLAGNAQYWIGEANYVSRNYKVALTEFRKVVDQYPQSGKQADALLKIGFIHYELGEWDKSRSALAQVKTRFPDTTPARLAEERLKKMKQEGH